jgi:glycosyltransferase involved in cell wall biosynthesis
MYCLRHKPDVVLALNVANGPAIPILKARRIPVVMNVDGVEWKRAKWGWFARNGFRAGAWMSARLAESLVADSREIGRIWEEDYGVPSVFIPYGGEVRDDLGDERVRALGFAPGSYALVVARLAPENNVELFLDAMQRLDHSIPAIVVGSANYVNPTAALLQDLDHAGKLRWLGHVDDQELLAELWANAGVYFHGHSVGGTNPALLSALGCGAPTIAVDTPFNEEVLGAECLVPADPERVATAISELIGDDEARATRSRVGKKRIQADYSWQAVLEDYEAELGRQAGRR